MLSPRNILVVVIFSLAFAQRKSIWKPYTNIPGKLNCLVEGGAFLRLSLSSFSGFCVARFVNGTNIYTGFMYGRATAEYVLFMYTELDGTWIQTENLVGVEVLDLDPTLSSWVPISLNPPEWMMIGGEHPYSAIPSRYICRSMPQVRAEFINTALGVMQDGVCRTRSWNQNFTTDFEVLILNGRSKLLYEYGFSGVLPNENMN